VAVGSQRQQKNIGYAIFYVSNSYKTTTFLIILGIVVFLIIRGFIKQEICDHRWEPNLKTFKTTCKKCGKDIRKM